MWFHEVHGQLLPTTILCWMFCFIKFHCHAACLTATLLVPPCLSIRLSVHLSVTLLLPSYLSVHCAVCLPLLSCLSVYQPLLPCLPVCLSVYHFITVTVILSGCPSFCHIITATPFVHLSVHLSVFDSYPIYLSLQPISLSHSYPI